MNTLHSKQILAATFTAFALTACSGADDASPSADSTQASNGESPSDGTTQGTSNQEPGANAPDVPTHTRIALQCQGPQAPNSNVVCLETAEGRAGDVIDLEVHLVRTAACGPADYAMGYIQIDPSKFELVNADDQQDCLRREQVQSFSDPDFDLIGWQAFGTKAPAGCSTAAGIGKVDVIKVRIKPGTAPGDYELPFETSELIGGVGSDPDCSGVFLDVAGKIRVLP